MKAWLTPARVRIYCAAVLATNITLLLVSASRAADYQIGGDYQAFYDAGLIFNRYPHRQLYDVELQDKVYEAEGGGVDSSLPFVNAPFFILPCSVVARLPYVLGFLTWTLASIGLVCFSYLLIWRVTVLPRQWRIPGLLAALAFPPFEFFTLRGGQASAFGLCALALAFYLYNTDRPAYAGWALSLLLYKPPLLLFVLPMLLFTKQWRMIVGFTCGGLFLAILSFLLVGIEGLIGYGNILKLFYVAGNSGKQVFQTWKYVDASAALALITGRSPRLMRLVFLLAGLPFLWRAWRKAGPSPVSWGLAIGATLLLNVYTPIYDVTLLIFVVLLVKPHRIGLPLLLTVFFLSAVTVPVAALTRVQLFTIALAWLACRLYRLSGPKFRPT